ncbi:MAG: response regulator [Planctomycetes bacterium]|nr:response regulator [Planctomycetota bacterium]
MAYVLIVDDDRDFADTAAAVLRQAGHDVSLVYDTEDALASMNRHRPDVLVLDVMFSEDISAGFALARAMRHHHEHLKGVPILMLTAVNTRFPLGFGRQDIDDEWLPVTDFLEKPVDLKRLVQRVAELLPDQPKSS